jgi:hypothetical protein
MLSRKLALTDPDIRRFVVLRCYRIIYKGSSKFFDPQVQETFSQLILPLFKTNQSLLHNYSQPIRQAEKLAQIWLDAVEGPDYAVRWKGLKEIVKIGYRLKAVGTAGNTTQSARLLNIRTAVKRPVKDYTSLQLETALTRANATQEPLVVSVYESLFRPTLDGTYIR